MVTKITEGVQITVEIKYLEAESHPAERYYLFAYNITIENKTSEIIKLLTRKWSIFDSNGEYREVEGPGVVGEQPILKPSEKFTYQSYCNLKTDIGKMSGSYYFEKLINHKVFEVEIPEFKLEVPLRLN